MRENKKHLAFIEALNELQKAHGIELWLDCHSVEIAVSTERIPRKFKVSGNTSNTSFSDDSTYIEYEEGEG
jgi:hypothetical protein